MTKVGSPSAVEVGQWRNSYSCHGLKHILRSEREKKKRLNSEEL